MRCALVTGVQTWALPICRRELGAIEDHVQAALEQADQVLRAVAFHAAGVGVGPLELLLGHVAIIALELLLGAQLDDEVGHLAHAALSVLAGTILALVVRALRGNEAVLANAAVEFLF